MPIRTPEKLKQKCIDLRQEGKTIKEVMEITGLSKFSVIKFAGTSRTESSVLEYLSRHDRRGWKKYMNQRPFYFEWLSKTPYSPEAVNTFAEKLYKTGVLSS